MTRVAVTTTRDTAPRIVGPLTSFGLDAVLLPCIRVEPADPATLARLRDASTSADLIVLTSRRPIEILWPDGRMPDVRVACVGAATAAAVEAAGGRVHFTGTGGSAALQPFLLQEASRKRVVFPHARAADPGLAEVISRVAATVVAAPAYDTVPIGPDPAPAVDSALFGSPSAVAGWTITRTLEGLVIGAMGGTTAAALAGTGHPAAVVPDQPGFEGLAAALAGHLDSKGDDR